MGKRSNYRAFTSSGRYRRVLFFASFARNRRNGGGYRPSNHQVGYGQPPDLPPAQTVIDTLAREAQRPDVHKYMSYQGEPILRKAFADWYKKFYGVDLDWKTEVYP